MWPWSQRSVLEADLSLKDARIKLASVATDVIGASGRAMIRRLIEGAQARRFGPAAVTGKIPELERALEGKLTDHHRFLLKLLRKELSSKRS